jgi:DNA repair protein RadC
MVVTNEPSSSELAVGELPQERIEAVGAGALSDTELLALLLRSGRANRKVMEQASRMIAEVGSLNGFARWQAVDFAQMGVGAAKARQLAAVMEIGRRMIEGGEAAPLLNRPELIVEHLRSRAHGLEVEKFWVVCLNRKNRLKKVVEVTTGTATSSLAHPREVFRCAIQYGATAIACAHNHPSGDPAPSAADVQLTRQLREAARAVDIDLIDHLVIGRTETDPTGLGYYSFRSAGVL